jgi:hypothetical protein
MRVNPDAARCRSSLGIRILVTEGAIGPSPASTHHQRLEVVLASKADRDWTVILLVVVHLVTRHRAASDESDKSLCRQGSGIPVATVAKAVLSRERQCRTTGRADDRTSRCRHPRQRSHASFLCRWYLSLSGQMRARPQPKVRRVPTGSSLVAPARPDVNFVAQSPPRGAGRGQREDKPARQVVRPVPHPPRRDRR